MPRLSKAEAARHMGISRTTLYKLIHAGTLSVHPDGTIDPAELVRAVSTLSVPVHRGHLDVHQMDSTNSPDGQRTRPTSRAAPRDAGRVCSGVSA
jgi:hypothetical protein